MTSESNFINMFRMNVEPLAKLQLCNYLIVELL